jgi:hypothetical protein
VPGSVANAIVATVLPVTLSSAFTRSQVYALLVNEYSCGETQRNALTTTSRKRWQISKRLTAAELDALRTFWLARGGGLEPFWFYDCGETSPPWNPAPSGSQGRYTVVFSASPWSSQMGLSRGDVGIELVEVA